VPVVPIKGGKRKRHLEGGHPQKKATHFQKGPHGTGSVKAHRVRLWGKTWTLVRIVSNLRKKKREYLLKLAKGGGYFLSGEDEQYVETVPG